MIVTCFECGKYCPIKSTSRHGNALDCDHKTYSYGRVKQRIHGDMEEVRPELKDFSPSYYQAKNLLVFPLDYIPDLDAFDVEAGNELMIPETIRPHRTPEDAEVTGVVRHWDRVEVYVEEVNTA